MNYGLAEGYTIEQTTNLTTNHTIEPHNELRTRHKDTAFNIVSELFFQKKRFFCQYCAKK
jgi:hypothetical protein